MVNFLFPGEVIVQERVVNPGIYFHIYRKKKATKK